MVSGPAIQFDHVHLISQEPHAAAAWYRDMLGGEIAASYQTRGAVQIRVTFGAVTILIRGQRPGEKPGAKNDLKKFDDYVSHDQWGTDHFGFSVAGDLRALRAALKAKGAEFLVEPYEFLPGRTIAYLKAPDGVTVELTEAE
jgi:catechol 2,3-dioxygenase-like lactoylglutathione lyase family enzyme